MTATTLITSTATIIMTKHSHHATFTIAVVNTAAPANTNTIDAKMIPLTERFLAHARQAKVRSIRTRHGSLQLRQEVLLAVITMVSFICITQPTHCSQRAQTCDCSFRGIMQPL